MVKNLWLGDLALIELARDGGTAAPDDVLAKLRDQGHITLSGGPKLTDAGRARAACLKDAEHDLRLMFTTSGGESKITTDGSGGSIHIGGGGSASIVAPR